MTALLMDGAPAPLSRTQLRRACSLLSAAKVATEHLSLQELERSRALLEVLGRSVGLTEEPVRIACDALDEALNIVVEDANRSLPATAAVREIVDGALSLALSELRAKGAA